MSDFTNIITTIIGYLQQIGGVLCVLGVIVGGLMRTISFGNERKVQVANMAIAAALVGLVIVLLAPEATNLLLGALQAPRVPTPTPVVTK